MGGYRIHDQHATYFFTFTIVDWIDLFTRQVYRDIVIGSLQYCISNKGLVLNAFVVMSNHVHLICSTSAPFEISDFVRDFKKYTAFRLLEQIRTTTESRRNWIMKRLSRQGRLNPNNRKYQVWQNDSHPVVLSNLKMLYQRLDYIHYNPVKAGLVDDPIHYLYSSARCYAGLPCLINVEVLEIMPLDGYLGDWPTLR